MPTSSHPPPHTHLLTCAVRVPIAVCVDAFRNTVALVISHSGGTFSTLAVANLLSAVTSDIFTVTSEWDTQIARAVREIHAMTRYPLASYTFSTFAGLRTAESCSLSLVATHTLLTHLLIFTMNHLVEDRLGGSSYEAEEVQELNQFHAQHIDAVELLVSADGNAQPNHSDTSRQLRAQGRLWAMHVLEAPIAWIISAAYIAATVLAGATPLSAAYAAAYTAAAPATAPAAALCAFDNLSLSSPEAANERTSYVAVSYVIRLLDSLIYIFLPWWTTTLLRLLQGRPLLHRVAGRTVLIADIPYVAQAVEAYLSKLFALSYSIANISVASSNPTDHLVHRHTHRVVRGSLLAVGRPDARLNALATGTCVGLQTQDQEQTRRLFRVPFAYLSLTPLFWFDPHPMGAADVATCLAIKQACAIVNLRHSCEAITLGHHDSKPDMVTSSLVLPTCRHKFLCEHLMERDGVLPGASTTTTQVTRP